MQQLEYKNAGTPYDVEDPSVGRLDGLDTYKLLTQANRMDPEDLKRADVVRALLPNSGSDLQIGRYLMVPNGTNVRIGDGVRIGGFVHLDDNGPLTIGNNVFIGSRTSVITIEHPLTPFERIGNFVRVRPVSIGDGAIVGANCTILPGVAIGKNAWVLDGSVINKDIPDGMLAGGKPGKVIRQLAAEEIAGGVKVYRALGRLGEDLAEPAMPGQLAATAAALAQFNLQTFDRGMFDGAIAFLGATIPTMPEFINNNIFPPFWCVNGANIRFVGSRSFINTGGIFYDSDPANPIVLHQGVFFGPNVEVHEGARFKDAAWVGANSYVGKGVLVGRGSIVAAGTVLPDGAEVPEFSIVGGNPWRVLRPVDLRKDGWEYPEGSMEIMQRRLDERKVDIEKLKP